MKKPTDRTEYQVLPDRSPESKYSLGSMGRWFRTLFNAAPAELQSSELSRSLDNASKPAGAAAALRRVAAWLLLQGRERAFRAQMDVADRVERESCLACGRESTEGIDVGGERTMCVECFQRRQTDPWG